MKTIRPRSIAMARLVAIVAVAAALLAACGNGAGGDARRSRAEDPEAVIHIEGLAFEPKALTIAAGASVTWTNGDGVLHTVTSGKQGKQGAPGVSQGRPAEPDGLFDRTLQEKQRFIFTFREPGVYSFYCDIHRQMSGEIVVS